jgi:hypothetical protein
MDGAQARLAYARIAVPIVDPLHAQPSGLESWPAWWRFRLDHHDPPSSIPAVVMGSRGGAPNRNAPIRPLAAVCQGSFSRFSRDG